MVQAEVVILTYGNYEYTEPTPDGTTRSEWDRYFQRQKDMAAWISEQKWDHWGTVKNPSGQGFWFSVEEEYAWFMLRWAGS